MIREYDLGNNFYINDDKLRGYFQSLPVTVQYQLLQMDTEIATLGELQQIAEHIKEM